jgi:hypothetical protein
MVVLGLKSPRAITHKKSVRVPNRFQPYHVMLHWKGCCYSWLLYLLGHSGRIAGWIFWAPKPAQSHFVLELIQQYLSADLLARLKYPLCCCCCCCCCYNPLINNTCSIVKCTGFWSVTNSAVSTCGLYKQQVAVTREYFQTPYREFESSWRQCCVCGRYSNSRYGVRNLVGISEKLRFSCEAFLPQKIKTSSWTEFW